MMNSDSSASYGYYRVCGYWWVVVYETVFSDVDCQAWWSCVYWLASVECVCKPYNGPVGLCKVLNRVVISVLKRTGY